MAAPTGSTNDPVARATDETGEAIQDLETNPRARERTRAKVGEYLDLPASLSAVLIIMLVLLQFSGKAQPAWQNPAAVLLWILWAFFVAEFLSKFALAPDKRRYLATHRRALLQAVVPVVGVARLVRPIRQLLIALIHLLLPTSADAGPYIAALKKRKLGQLAIISAVIILIGGTAEYYFEAGAPGASITSFGAAVWWSAATATTVANQLYPVTTGGEIVGFAMMVYAVCVFGYLASSLASVLVAGDAQRPANTDQTPSDGQTGPPHPSAEADGTIHLTDREIQVLRAILARLQQS